MRAQGRLKIGDLGVAAYQARDRRTQISGVRVDSTQWRKVRRQTRRTHLEHPDRRRPSRKRLSGTVNLSNPRAIFAGCASVIHQVACDL